MLHPHPEGATRVVVCCQLPCALRGASRVLRQLGAGLGIEPGQTSSDHRFTLERTTECFGACHRAPMAIVNETYWENLSPEATQTLLDALRGAVPSPGAGRRPVAERQGEAERPPLPVGEGGGEGSMSTGNQPSPGLRPASPRGRGKRP